MKALTMGMKITLLFLGLLHWDFASFAAQTGENGESHDSAATPAELAVWNKNPKHRWGMKLKATASSAIPPTRAASYGPENAIDGRPETAWCFQGKKGGKGEWLDVCDLNDESLGMYIQLKAIGIIPGYAKSDKSLSANGRVQRVRVTDKEDPKKQLAFDLAPLVGTGKDRLRIFGNLVPHEAASDVLPIENIFHGLKKCLRFEILEVKAASKSSDVCISEIVLQLRWDE